MLFDIRGRRKHVVRVVYAILALLMGASLFLVVGPVNIGSLLGTSSTTEAAKVLNEQAERVEAKLRKEPDNPNLLVAATRARVGAANAQVEVDPQTGAPLVSAEALQNFTLASDSWNRYVEQTDEVNSSVALLMANTYFTLAQAGTAVEEIASDLTNAADAQRLATEARPSVGFLTTLATYEYLAGNFKAGDQAGDEAKAKATGQEKKQVEEQLTEYRKRGKQWEAEKKRVAKAEKEQGKEALQNPFGGLGGSSGSLGE
jgi:hypothetical protein